MKKLLVLFICFFLSTTFAQTLLLEYNGENVADGDTIVGVTTNMNGETPFFIDLTNNTDSRVQLKVRKETLSLVTDAYCSFCLGECYSGDESIFPYEMNAGESLTHAEAGDLAFHLNYNPNRNEGTSLFHFTIFDETNPNISTSFYFSVTASANVGIQNYNTNTLSAYPNPAKNYVTINYTISNSPAKLVIRNLVGAIIFTQNINPADSKVKISLSNFKTGVYFYSIEQNNKALLTKKLIVK